MVQLRSRSRALCIKVAVSGPDMRFVAGRPCQGRRLFHVGIHLPRYRKPFLACRKDAPSAALGCRVFGVAFPNSFRHGPESCGSSLFPCRPQLLALPPSPKSFGTAHSKTWPGGASVRFTLQSTNQNQPRRCISSWQILHNVTRFSEVLRPPLA